MNQMLIAVVAAASLAMPVPHAGLKSSIPAKNSTVTSSPRSVSLTFTEEVVVAGTQITILKSDSTLVEKLTVKGLPGDTTVVGAVTKQLANGRYIVKWRNASKDDGHPASGSFSFTVAAK